ncbi:LOW QUALITY PROTEIN: Hypothetical protein PHPALM_904 [Phytophthora palmivora]|uniref:Uncharacterized protein n=1 Tax=Phytophthora palmivora TaxID=4796 RepID=A0A2P4YTM4_9STRA|nr:LOW QUALITY PROTEIN: Hypothetical protein PHPALM_904 [Phytophthora palmivora]
MVTARVGRVTVRSVRPQIVPRWQIEKLPWFVRGRVSGKNWDLEALTISMPSEKNEEVIRRLGDLGVLNRHEITFKSLLAALATMLLVFERRCISFNAWQHCQEENHESVTFR